MKVGIIRYPGSNCDNATDDISIKLTSILLIMQDIEV